MTTKQVESTEYVEEGVFKSAYENSRKMQEAASECLENKTSLSLTKAAGGSEARKSLINQDVFDILEMTSLCWLELK